MNKKTWLIKPLTLMISLAALSATSVQAQDTSSSIRGKVLDTSGSPDSGVEVSILDTRTGVTRTYTTNSAGSFFASNLPVGGPYEVTLSTGEAITVQSLALGDAYRVTLGGEKPQNIEEVRVVGEALTLPETAPGPSVVFGLTDLQNAVSIDRDIKDVYRFDPRLSVDNDGGSPVNCVGKHPRFNSFTVDGVSHNDRFGLNSNGYSTATGMPIPYDAIDQVAVELAPFDVTYTGFSACNINAVTKSGSNEWDGSVFYEYTSDSFIGDSLSSVSGRGDVDLNREGYTEDKYGVAISGPIIKDTLFFSAAYEETEFPEFIAQGFDGSGNGEEREWLSEAQYNRVLDAAQNIYGFDPGGQPGNGTQTEEKYMARIDWNINDSHNMAMIYNYYEGIESRSSDGDSNEFEFSNHFYDKGAESETYTLMIDSQWTDSFSTSFFYSVNELTDSQVTVGDPSIADFQLTGIDGGEFNTIYLGADDSRQANSLSYESDYLKLSAQYLAGDHVLTFGYDREELDVFNIFVQHSRGGEIDFFYPTLDEAITAFENGEFTRFYYGSGGGTNVPEDAAAIYTNIQNSLYFQDEWYMAEYDLTLTAGFRYDWIDSDDTPAFNQSFFDATGFRNDVGLDGVDIFMPRFGFTWDAADDISFRGGIGLFAGGNPNVWISNNWTRDGLSNAQFDCRTTPGNDCGFAETDTLFDVSSNPGFDDGIPTELTDLVAAVSPADATVSGLSHIDEDFKMPGEWKFALGLTKDFDNGVKLDLDFLHTRTKDAVITIDSSQEVVAFTTTGQPIYDYIDPSVRNNYLLTNSDETAESTSVSLVLSKYFDNGLDIVFGYALTGADDISPMTSSTASSNFENLALLDINNPLAGTSNYEVPHRFTLQASYEKDFISNLTTRFTLQASRESGQSTSYVMQSTGLEADNDFGRHLLYVPTGVDDPNVVFSSGFDTDAFFSWIDAQGYEGGTYVPRNSAGSKWNSLVNLRIDQELPTFMEGTTGLAFIKIYNLANLLNDRWGHQYDAQFFNQTVVTSPDVGDDPGPIVNASGQYLYDGFRVPNANDFQQNASFWEIKMGLEFRF